MQSESSRPLYRGVQVVWYALYVVQMLLAIRFLLKLLGANPGAAFTNFIYSVSGVFTWPFATVFQNSAVSGSVFEWTTLLAMLIYWLLAVALIKLFLMGKPVSVGEADAKLTQEEQEIL